MSPAILLAEEEEALDPILILLILFQRFPYRRLGELLQRAQKRQAVLN